MSDQKIIKTRNNYISYLKGWAIISIILIHLLDWSNAKLTHVQELWREPLYFGVMLFIALSGSVVYVAYNRYTDFWTYFKRLWRRAGELFAVYFIYNIVKLLVFNFETQPFFWQFKEKGTFDIKNILLLHSFSVPLTILLTIGCLLLLSPFLLWLVKKTKQPKILVLALIALLFVLNYVFVLPENFLTNFLYSKNLVLFPILYWLLPFLIGFYLAMIGLEKHKAKCLLIFTALTVGSYFFYHLESWRFSYYMYPLRPYYIFAGFAFAYLLIYLFFILEKIKIKLAGWILDIFKFLGDHTLFLYTVHWLVVDLVIWAYFPDVKKIRWYVLFFILLYLVYNRKKVFYKK